MYLIDTSVWIDYLRDKKNQYVEELETILDRKLPFGITSVIYQELLQGAASEKDFDQLKNYLSTQRFFHPKDAVKTFESAAYIYLNCRRKGITIRSTIDCLIAQLCIEHDLILVHNDHDFTRIQSITPELKLIHS